MDRLITTPERNDMLQADLVDSLIVYDQSTSQGHDLQPLAAFVWKSCDGKTSVSDIARRARDEYGVESGEEVVLFILDQLKKKRLLKDTPDLPKSYSVVSRRDMVSKYIPAAMVLPFIMTAVAPTRAQLRSHQCVPVGGRRPPRCR